MRTHSIAVTVEGDAIRVEPETLVMTTQDEVQWSGTNARRFSIEFEGAGPFASARLNHSVASGRQKPQNKGRFKYTVISEENAGLRLDPVIIVDPPPSSGTD